ncbi:hypothetical protein BDK92_6594 [Micromonospora pisi]|uniref:WD40 repeat protein n=1 Tax=Micromonospora pisi TaxID=589240 RepID=A0A495JT41_9ACTN|nr:hypothetical protein [Micromonospora pisi]RKR92160.1 hypothetical protein BDK92_6594 [Micromonospora pisi]
MPRFPRLITRIEGELIRAYGFAAPPSTTVTPEPVAAFPVPEGIEVESPTVAPDLSRAAYAASGAVVCVDREGRTLWRLDGVGDRVPESGLAATSCVFSLDGTVVWIYTVDGVALWIAVAADTGTVVDRAVLDGAGAGGRQFVHPDGVHVLLGVAEEQSTLRVHRARLERRTIELTTYPWDDRRLVDLSPAGDFLMTIHHDQRDVAFHSYPEGEVVIRVPAASFGYDDNTYPAFIIDGGYLDSDTAIVTLAGDLDETLEWELSHYVDVRTGRNGEMVEREPGPYRDGTLVPLGDGTWLSIDIDHRFRRNVR